VVDPTKALVARLFADHGGALQAFFYRRIRSKAETADLAQEVYLRMLRIPDTDAIRSPEAYLFTVASNLVKEQAVLEARQAAGVDAEDDAVAGQLAQPPRYEDEIDTGERVKRLREVLGQLPAKCRAAVVLQYKEGLSYQQIGERLGVSQHMVKKYLSQALVHCRRRMTRLE
jgi:RNA polymerase sigma factor (sigma-70 family)